MVSAKDNKQKKIEDRINDSGLSNGFINDEEDENDKNDKNNNNDNNEIFNT